jgi:hypothetical protein
MATSVGDTKILFGDPRQPKCLPLSHPKARWSPANFGTKTEVLRQGYQKKKNSLPLPCDMIFERDMQVEVRIPLPTEIPDVLKNRYSCEMARGSMSMFVGLQMSRSLVQPLWPGRHTGNRVVVEIRFSMTFPFEWECRNESFPSFRNGKLPIRLIGCNMAMPW